MRLSGKKIFACCLALTFVIWYGVNAFALTREERREMEEKSNSARFKWWPTDAMPGPVEDKERGGYWWWPVEPGKATPWGNQGYIYVRKIIFQEEGKPALLLKRIISNVKIYFDYDKADLREDANMVLNKAVQTLGREPEAEILITGNCDRRGDEAYNERLGERRGEAVRQFMLSNGIPERRIRILSRGKLDAVAPITDLVGMQKDRNAQFMIAEVVEIQVPPDFKPPEGQELIEETQQVESAVQVKTEEYVVKQGDTLWKIAEMHYGKGRGYRWKYLYEFNKNKIKDPNKLKPGTKILLPVE